MTSTSCPFLCHHVLIIIIITIHHHVVIIIIIIIHHHVVIIIIIIIHHHKVIITIIIHRFPGDKTLLADKSYQYLTVDDTKEMRYNTSYPEDKVSGASYFDQEGALNGTLANHQLSIWMH